MSDESSVRTPTMPPMPSATPEPGKIRVGFLGPHGTFAEEALLTQPDLAAGVAVPFRDVPHVINAVENGEVDLGIVPIENSIEGSITGHARHARVRHRSAGAARGRPPGLAEPVRAARARSWPTSPPWCRIRTRSASPGSGWRKHLPDAVAIVANSTAEAAAAGGEVEASRDGVDRHRARARSTTGSRSSPATSRTIRRTRPASCSSGTASRLPTGHDKTSVVCFQRQDRPGSLLAILQEFAARAINLTKLESRPTKREPRRLLLLHRLRGPSRRRARRRLPAQPGGEAGPGEVPRLVSGRGRRGPRPAAGRQQGLARREHVARRRCASRSAPTDPPRSTVIDLKRLRDEPDYRAGIERKRVAPDLIDDVLDADAARRELLATVEELRRARTRRRRRSARPRRRTAAKIAAAGRLKEELDRARPRSPRPTRPSRARAPVPNPADAVRARRRRGRRRGRAGRRRRHGAARARPRRVR